MYEQKKLICIYIFITCERNFILLKYFSFAVIIKRFILNIMWINNFLFFDETMFSFSPTDNHLLVRPSNVNMVYT